MFSYQRDAERKRTAAERLSQGITAGVDLPSTAVAVREIIRVDDAPGASSAGASAQAGPDVVVPPQKDSTAPELFSVEQEPDLQPQVPPEQPPPPQQSLPFADARADEAAAAFNHLQVTDAGEKSSEPDAPAGMDTNDLQDYEEEENA